MGNSSESAGLLLGFAVLSKIFEESGVPDILPKYLLLTGKGPFFCWSSYSFYLHSSTILLLRLSEAQ